MTPDMVAQVVAVARAPRASYGDEVALPTLGRLLSAWGLDRERQGTASWNPLGQLIRPGARVVIKPNWVMHRNESGQGLDCLITHASVIAAVLHYLLPARPGQVVLGDAPLQGCDFAALRRLTGIDKVVERFVSLGLDLSLCDFRRTILLGERLGAPQVEDIRSAEHYVLFDLGSDSLLEPLSRDADRFRVTMYHPDRMRRTHAPGRHQYLIAREVLEADVILNLAKIKTHRKACVTGALKNLVGVNGNKEYLPHHRKGGHGSGGDCYQGGSFLKQRAEDLLDAANRRPAGPWKSLLVRAALEALRLAGLAGHDRNIEGSWHGNDTVWRTCLDLQRIVAYGRPDGTLAEKPLRRIISIADAIIGGQGEGPLCSIPIASGFLTGALDPAAADYVNARLMGLDPRRIPLIREAFRPWPWPISQVAPSRISVRISEEGGGVRVCPADQVRPVARFRPAAGWRGHCELQEGEVGEHDTRTREPAVLAQVPVAGRTPHP